MVDSSTPRSAIRFRVDARLVHATLMNAWVPNYDLAWIWVADDEVVTDARRRHIYEMSAMDAADVRFITLSSLANAMKTPAKGPGIVLFANLHSARIAASDGVAIEKLVVGHLPKGEEGQQLHPSVFLSESDYDEIKMLRSLGVEVYAQPLPNDPPIVPDVPTGDLPVVTASNVVEGELEIVNERGLHLRAAHLLVQATSRLPDDIEVGFAGRMVNAKSLLGLTTLGASCGSLVRLVVRGPSAQASYDEVARLFAGGFEEGSTADLEASW